MTASLKYDCTIQRVDYEEDAHTSEPTLGEPYEVASGVHCSIWYNRNPLETNDTGKYTKASLGGLFHPTQDLKNNDILTTVTNGQGAEIFSNLRVISVKPWHNNLEVELESIHPVNA